MNLLSKLIDVTNLVEKVKHIVELHTVDAYISFYNLKEFENIQPYYNNLEYDVLSLMAEKLNQEVKLSFSFRVISYQERHSLEVFYQDELFGKVNVKEKTFVCYFTPKEKFEQWRVVKQFYVNTVYVVEEKLGERENKYIKLSNSSFKLFNSSRIKLTSHVIEDMQKQLEEAKQKSIEFDEKLEEVRGYDEDVKYFFDFIKGYTFKVLNGEEELSFRTFTVFENKNGDSYLQNVKHYNIHNYFGTPIRKTFVALSEEVELDGGHLDYMRYHLTTNGDFRRIIGFYEDTDVQLIHADFNIYRPHEEVNELEEIFRNIYKINHQMYDEISYDEMDITKIIFKYKGNIFTINSFGTIFTSEDGYSVLEKEIFA